MSFTRSSNQNFLVQKISLHCFYYYYSISERSSSRGLTNRLKNFPLWNYYSFPRFEFSSFFLSESSRTCHTPAIRIQCVQPSSMASCVVMPIPEWYVLLYSFMTSLNFASGYIGSFFNMLALHVPIARSILPLELWVLNETVRYLILFS